MNNKEREQHLYHFDTTIGCENNRIFGNKLHHMIHLVLLKVQDRLFSHYNSYRDYPEEEPKLETFEDTLDYVDEVVDSIRQAWPKDFERYVLPVFETNVSFRAFIKDYLKMQRTALGHAFYEVKAAKVNTKVNEIKFD